MRIKGIARRESLPYCGSSQCFAGPLRRKGESISNGQEASHGTGQALEGGGKNAIVTKSAAKTQSVSSKSIFPSSGQVPRALLQAFVPRGVLVRLWLFLLLEAQNRVALEGFDGDDSSGCREQMDP